jgi:putative holliday junction resolvase
MKIIGLDLGSKTCGIAQSDRSELIAAGVDTLRFEEDRYDIALALVADKIKELKGEKVVIGLPKHMNGDIGVRGEINLTFAGDLAALTGLVVDTWDERLTTVSANKLLIAADVSREKRKAVVDKVAATFILQAYLDANKYKR